MAKMSPNFSRVALQDPTTGLRDILGKNISRIEKADRLKALQEQQALENTRAGERLKLSQAADQRSQQEAEFKAAERERLLGIDQQLSDIYKNIPSTKTATETVITKPGISGTAGNLAEIEAAKTSNVNRLDRIADINKQVLEATDIYDAMMDKDSEVVQGKIDDPISNVNGIKVSGLGDFAQPVDVKATKPYEINVVKSPINTSTETDELRRKFAFEQSGLNRLNKYLLGLPKAEVIPKLIKAVNATPAETKEIQRQVKLKPAEQISNLKNSLLNSDLPGSVKQDALANVDKMFPQPEAMKTSDQISLARLQHQMLKDASLAKEKRETVQGYQSVYPNAPKNLTTVKGFEAWEKKMNKGLKSKDDFARSLYAELTSKDSEDVKAIDNFLNRNSKALDKLNNSQKIALVARLKALYNQESAYFDPSDYIPLLDGSAAGDILNDFNLK